MGKLMVKKKAAGGAAARHARTPTRATAEPQREVQPAAAQTPSETAVLNEGASVAAPGGAARGAGPLALGSALSIRDVGERIAQIRAMFDAGAA
ncbi:MAG TPA: hypothetical protein VII41_11805, partial [Steroidobacteraceae bacterium]